MGASVSHSINARSIINTEYYIIYTRVNERRCGMSACARAYDRPQETVRGTMSVNSRLPRPQLPLEQDVEEGTTAFHMQAIQESLKSKRERFK